MFSYEDEGAEARGEKRGDKRQARRCWLNGINAQIKHLKPNLYFKPPVLLMVDISLISSMDVCIRISVLGQFTITYPTNLSKHLT